MPHHILLVAEDEKIYPDALVYVRELARRLDATVTLLMIVPMSFASQKGLGPQRNTIRSIETRAEKILAECLQPFIQEGINAKFALAIGDPAQEMVKFLADRPPFQSIVWGSGRELPDRARGGQRHWLSKVAGSLECPLLTVSKREEEGGNRGEAIMDMLKRLKKSGNREREIRNFCIQTLRFKKLLENGRALLDLFADGREKFAGEYIFDRHYVVSLIDRVIDRMGMMVYDAGVLVPDAGESFYAACDDCRLAARRLIDQNAAGPPAATGADSSGADDPEYRLLADALRWFYGTGAAADGTVMDLIRQTFSRVMREMTSEAAQNREALFESCGLKAADMAMYVVDLWKDGRSLPGRQRVTADFNSIPFRHLLPAGRDEQGGGSWVAAVSEHQLSLQSLRPEVGFRLETLASGYESSDFIFVFTDRPAALTAILPEQFHVESVNGGQFAWSLDIPAATMGDTLRHIGRHLFDESVWRTP